MLAVHRHLAPGPPRCAAQASCTPQHARIDAHAHAHAPCVVVRAAVAVLLRKADAAARDELRSAPALPGVDGRALRACPHYLPRRASALLDRWPAVPGVWAEQPDHRTRGQVARTAAPRGVVCHYQRMCGDTPAPATGVGAASAAWPRGFTPGCGQHPAERRVLQRGARCRVALAGKLL